MKTIFICSIVTAMAVVCTIGSVLASTAEETVQLTVSITNNTVIAGTDTIIHCLTKNLSTNDIYFAVSNPRSMYTIVMVDKNGRKIELNNSLNYDDSDKRGLLHPGRTFEADFHLLIKTNLEAGNYMLSAIQALKISGQSYNAKSAPIEIQLMKK